ncbi:unnamed protein product [Orchesella dallaii]|uniref:Uncharacterized protein n=1 Tax=Orchesella dallaii TaxID=48710 RepID=A0ABP1Q067_9HEXA
MTFDFLKDLDGHQYSADGKTFFDKFGAWQNDMKRCGSIILVNIGENCILSLNSLLSLASFLIYSSGEL